jgi:MATE family multidrug resistance protein
MVLGQPEAPARLAEPYVLAVAPGLSFMVATMALRNFLAVIGHTRAPLLFIVVSTALNAFLNWLLIYGNWGFPRLELVGAGIASSVSNFAGFALIVLYIRLEPSSRRFHLFRGFARASWARLREVVQLGWPISVTATFEAMLFNAAVFLMGRIGVDEMAAYQVALNVAALAFMMPLGLSMAGAVRVGLMKGKGDGQGVRTAAGVSILACIGAIMLVAVPVMLSPRGVASLYLDPTDPASARLLELVASFLPVAAAFALFDATQVAANQALRGLKDVRVPMVITAFAYWGVGFPLAAWLGLRSSLGAIGVWWGLLAALAVAAVLLGLRLITLTRRFSLRHPSANGSSPAIDFHFQ